MENELSPETNSDPLEKQKHDDVKALYDQLCVSYHAIDDFRTKLLGFLPLATAAGVATLLIKELNLTIPWSRPAIDGKAMLLTPIGVFGFLVTLGLYCYELYGIKKCRALIETGIYLEQKMGCVGQFATRPNRAMRAFNEPVAGAIIYSVVMAAWVLMACMFWWGLQWAQWVAIAVFTLFCVTSIRYGVVLEKGHSLDHLEPLTLIRTREKPNRSTPTQGA